jgi:hypothetical protein
MNSELTAGTAGQASVASNSGSAWVRDWGGVATLALGGYVTAFWLWQVFQWGGPERKVLIGDLAYLPGALLSAVLAWRAGTHHDLDAGTRRAWRWIAIAHLVFWTGDALWAYFELVLGIEPFPSLADAGYLLFYPFMLLGLLSFPLTRWSRAERIRFLLDAATVLTGGWMVV